jgi:hypothetical protein
MSIDPADLRWLEARFGVLETDAGDLLIATQKLVLMQNTADHRIKVTDDRNKTLWSLCTALALGLVASVGTHIYWAGSVDSILKAQSKQIEDLQGSVRALTKDVDRKAE